MPSNFRPLKAESEPGASVAGDVGPCIIIFIILSLPVTSHRGFILAKRPDSRCIGPLCVSFVQLDFDLYSGDKPVCLVHAFVTTYLYVFGVRPYMPLKLTGRLVQGRGPQAARPREPQGL